MGNPTVTQHSKILQQFQKVCPGIKVTAKDQLVILGATLQDAVKRDPLSTKIEGHCKISNTVEHLDAHYGFPLLQNSFSIPKLYSLRTSTCFAEKDLLKQYDILKKALSKVQICVTRILSSLCQFFRPHRVL